MQTLRRTRTGALAPADQTIPAEKPEINRESEYSWWFDWERDEDPLTFWDRRLARRRGNQNSGNQPGGTT